MKVKTSELPRSKLRGIGLIARSKLRGIKPVHSAAFAKCESKLSRLAHCFAENKTSGARLPAAIIITLALAFSAIFGAAPACAAGLTEPSGAPGKPASDKDFAVEVSSPSVLVMDAKTGVIVFEKNKDQKNYPASTTKVMTALLTLEYAKKGGVDRLDERVSFSHEAVFSLPYGSSNIAMDEGETLSIEEALYALLLPSANEVANALAEHISGSQEAFALAMTNRAEELGANNTHFTNAHGLHGDLHFSTAHDMAIIMREALKHPEFVRIISTVHYDLPPTERQPETRPLNNSDRMILPTSEYYNEDIVGGKTGFTNEAMHTLVSYGKRDGIELIVSVMHGNERGAPYIDTTALLNYGFNQYEEVTLLAKDEYTLKTPVVAEQRGEKTTVGYVDAAAEEDIRLFMPKNAADKAVVADDAPKELARSVTKGESIGTVTVSYGGVTLGSTRLIAQNSVEAPEPEPQKPAGSGELPFGLTWVKLIILAAMLIFAVLAALVFLARANRKSRRTMRYGLRRSKPLSYRYKNH